MAYRPVWPENRVSGAQISKKSWISGHKFSSRDEQVTICRMSLLADGIAAKIVIGLVTHSISKLWS